MIRLYLSQLPARAAIGQVPKTWRRADPAASAKEARVGKFRTLPIILSTFAGLDRILAGAQVQVTKSACYG
jgi:hypothetical protein